MDNGGPGEVLKVRIPPGAGPNMRLRLRGKGRVRNGIRGDLYLKIHLS